MKIAYLHGLVSTIDQKDPKIIFLNNTFDEVYTPQINYKDKNTFNKLLKDIKRMQPDLIVGSSMGGYVSYLIGNKLTIPTLLFNPALIGRSFDPEVDNSDLKGTNHTIFFGKMDKVINGNGVKSYLKEEGVGQFSYNSYNGGHRVPVDVFIDGIKGRLGISEIYNNMKHVKLFEQFVNEGLFKNHTEVIGYELDKFIDGYKELHKDNMVVYDKKEDVTYGIRKGSKEAHWRYNHEDAKLHSDLNDKYTLGLINFKKMVSKNHEWSK